MKTKHNYHTDERCYDEDCFFLQGWMGKRRQSVSSVPGNRHVSPSGSLSIFPSRLASLEESLDCFALGRFKGTETIWPFPLLVSSLRKEKTTVSDTYDYILTLTVFL